MQRYGGEHAMNKKYQDHRATQDFRLERTTGTDRLTAGSWRLAGDTDPRVCAAFFWIMNRRFESIWVDGDTSRMRMRRMTHGARAK